MPTNEEVLDFILNDEELSKDLEDSNYNKLFRDCERKNVELVPYVSSTLLNSGINFLKDMNNIPRGCFVHSPIDSIDIPENIKVINDYAFLGCKNLRDVELPKSLERIGEGAFRGCDSITYFEIPDSVKELGGYCVPNNLENLVLGSGIEVINHSLGGAKIDNLYVQGILKDFPSYIAGLNRNLNIYCDKDNYIILEAVSDLKGVKVYDIKTGANLKNEGE